MSEYLDTNILVYYLIGDRQFGVAARDYLLSIAKGDRSASTSVYTFAELYATFRNVGLSPRVILPRLEASLNMGINLADLTQIVMLGVPAEMRRGRSFGDAIHHLTMREIGVDHIVSEDRDWDRVHGVHRISLSEIGRGERGAKA